MAKIEEIGKFKDASGRARVAEGDSRLDWSGQRRVRMEYGCVKNGLTFL